MMRQQRGFSFFGFIFLIAVIGAVVSITIKVLPPYIDFLTISEATLGVIEQPRMGLQRNDEILKKIDKQLSINNISLSELGRKAVVIEREQNLLIARIDYTLLKPVFESDEFQVALSMHFQKTHEVPFKQ